MPKEKKLKQWQINKAEKNSAIAAIEENLKRRQQEAAKDPSSWLRPGWTVDGTTTDDFNTGYLLIITIILIHNT